jgi:hypothetical protein
VVEQRGSARQRRGVARRHVDAGDAVHDGVDLPADGVADDGTPQAIASSGTMPNGSYQGTQTTTSAERSSAGISSRPTRPAQHQPVATPSAAASSAAARASGSASSAPASGRRRRAAPRPAARAAPR